MGARRIALALLVLIPVAGAHTAAAFDGPLEAAAYTWLELIDQGRFDDAFREGDALLRSGVTQSEWTEATRKAREHVGAVASRDVISKDYHRQIDGGPPGNYFTLRIHTRMTDGREVVEIVTLMAGTDQKYRTVAYGTKR